jgi:lipopolysaccharide transport system permease protein
MEQSTTSVPTNPASEPDNGEHAVDSASLETVRLEPTHGFSRLLDPSELWRYRDLALQLVARDVTVRYRQTALGAAWAVLQPIGLMVVFSLIFGRAAGISSDGVPYALFSLTAVVPWTFFANALLLASESLIINNALVSKIYFPRIFMPFAVIGAGLLDMAISIGIMLAVVIVYGTPITFALLTLPLFVVMVAATALGAGAGLAAINVRYRDVRYVVPFTIQMWLFLSPVAYPSSLLSEPLRTISAINPMVGIVEGFRWAALGNGSCPLELIGISLAAAVVLLALGLAYFDRVERGFADII